MSYTSFPAPSDDHNPFQDPAVTQHSSNTGYATLDLYNPFDNKTGPPPPYEATSPTPASAPAQTPPSRTTPTEPRNYGSYTSPQQAAVNATTAELLRKQEELEKKARDLEKRERELESHSLGPGAFGAATLLFNLVSSLAMFIVDSTGGVGLGLAILWALLFTPCSFVCWYRPVYKAFRSDSSFNFFAFFFIFFAQVVLFVIMTIGIPGWGFSGWIVSLAALQTSIPVGVIMMINSIFFTAQTAMGIVMLKKVHSMYRQTDASFQKAQAEFATGVMANQAVRQAATNAAQGAFTGPR
ncbi:hypothetical protein CRUP_002150 [Coryphaenoides rupestris]|nr:hypothetical protein CRUP_002150 [Coryphaenoides rupestris]